MNGRSCRKASSSSSGTPTRSTSQPSDQVEAHDAEHEDEVEEDAAEVGADSCPAGQPVVVRDVRIEGRVDQVQPDAHPLRTAAAVAEGGGVPELVEAGRERRQRRARSGAGPACRAPGGRRPRGRGTAAASPARSGSARRRRSATGGQNSQRSTAVGASRVSGAIILVRRFSASSERAPLFPPTTWPSAAGTSPFSTSCVPTSTFTLSALTFRPVFSETASAISARVRWPSHSSAMR